MLLSYRYHRVLESHGINLGASSKLPDVDIKLPPLKGNTIINHFHEIANEQLAPYKRLMELLAANKIPSMPTKWEYREGWTRYDCCGNAVAVDFPEENALVFDIEVCMKEGSAPTMACAVGEKYWYSWSSKQLFDKTPTESAPSDDSVVRVYCDTEMIPMEPDSNKEPRLIIGHNVSFDRARIRNQYQLETTATRFLDTMSMHVCVSGVTSYQRAMLQSKKPIDDADLRWTSQSSLNNLADVFRLYCKDENNEQIDKKLRSVFVDGSLDDIRANFQILMTYCAKDVSATLQVFKQLYPLFCERFPHPATLTGMLEIGLAYLPVNSNWIRYINESQLIYKDFDIEAKYLLVKRANQACRLMHNDAFKTDLWLWSEDWSTQNFKLLKAAEKKLVKLVPSRSQIKVSTNKNDKHEYEQLRAKFKYLFDISQYVPKRPPLLSGYPKWYRDLCKKWREKDWQPGPTEMGTGMQIAPKLLSLCWEGYPLHYIRGKGWGFLVPIPNQVDSNYSGNIPMKQLIEKCANHKMNANATIDQGNGNDLGKLVQDVEMDLGKKDYYSKAKTHPTDGKYNGTGVWCETEIQDVCWFFKLPHKNGAQLPVGNPLARDFLVKFSENVLAGDSAAAERVIQIARMLSYWRNNRDRITGQIIVGKLNDTENERTAAILPMVVTCGTLTRRASERTWMTASNSQLERIGSELRAMVQAPPNYRIVGADVDSEELWIASVLGDADATGIHGATPFGWMTLNGTKANGTDMHSVTAKAVGITRTQAKILNYARIYGAGQMFSTSLLKQFNPAISDGEAKSKAMKMFTLTKGKKLYMPKKCLSDQLEMKGCSAYEARILCQKFGKPLDELFERPRWNNGTESAMFNRLEEIASSEQTETPFLKSRLSRALEPTAKDSDRFLMTRVNWVVQSGAVDFLHLMLVCMRWLMKDNIRFCLSFHDEVRYIVKDEHAYKAALAMHLTNLLTRSFCVQR